MAVVVSVVMTAFNLVLVFVRVFIMVEGTLVLTMEVRPPDILGHLVDILGSMLSLLGDLVLSIIVVLLEVPEP